MEKSPEKRKSSDDDDDAAINPPKCRRAGSAEEWDVEDVLDERGGDYPGEHYEALVKWKNIDLEPEWVKLKDNPAMAEYLDISPKNLSDITNPNPEILSLRQAIFDELGYCMATPSGKTGYSPTFTVTVPMSEKTFKTAFRSLEHPDLPIDGTGNVEDCELAHHELNDALGGRGWDRRGNEETSTLATVSPFQPITMSWGYKERVHYDHSTCRRCSYTLSDEDKRPSMCSGATKKAVVGPPWITLKLWKRRMNTAR